MSSNDRYLPYLKRALSSNEDRRMRAYIQEAIERLETDARRRNALRYEQWLAAGRLDLCTDLLAESDDKSAVKFADLTLPLRARIASTLENLHGHLSPGKELVVGPEFAKLPAFSHYSGRQVVVPATAVEHVFVHADRCTIRAFGKFTWFVAVRSELDDPLKPAGGSGEWIGSVLLANCIGSIHLLDHSIAIFDGDIEIDEGMIAKSLVIANGDIVLKNGNEKSRTSVRNSLLAATGKVRLEGELGGTGNSVIQAGGKIQATVDKKANIALHENRGTLPLGIKFLNPKEFGLDLAMQNGGLQVLGITPESPFAKFGVQDADVITKIDDVTPKSLPEFRRALRHGVIRESVVLHIKRENKMITRIAFLDGVPAPVAPMPRETKR